MKPLLKNIIGHYHSNQATRSFYAMRRRMGLLEVQIIEQDSPLWVRVIKDTYLTINGIKIE